MTLAFLAARRPAERRSGRPGQPLFLLWLAALVFPAWAQAQTALSPTAFLGRGWYVDAAAGKDTNPGTQALPFKSLARASSVVLGRGDAILLRCGSVFRESLTVTRKMAPMGAPSVGAYGSCTTSNRPVISGADPVVADWTLDASFGGNPVYVASVDGPVKSLYWNGAPLVRARYPNYGGIGAEYAKIKAGVGSTAFTMADADRAALSGSSLAGADIKIRSNPWLIESLKVAGADLSDGSVELVSAPKSAAPRAGVGYFVEGQRSLLDTAGEFHWDQAAGKLYVWTWNGAKPSSGLLERVVRDIGVQVVDVHDVKLDRLAIDRHGSSSLVLRGADRVAVTRVLARRANGGAIRVMSGATSGTGARIVDSEINEAVWTSLGVFVPNMTVTGTVIRDHGLGSRATGAWGPAVELNRPNTTFTGNRLLRTAGVAVSIGDVPGLLMRGNEVDAACSRFSDCGAVYAWGTATSQDRKTVESNWVHDMVANTEGAVGGAPKMVAALYLDHKTSHFDFFNNMVSRIGINRATGEPAGDGLGIHIHSSSFNRIERNKIWLVTKAALHVQSSWEPTGDLLRGNSFVSNYLYAGGFMAPLGSKRVFVPAYAQQWSRFQEPMQLFAGTDPNVARDNMVFTLGGSDGPYWKTTGPTRSDTHKLAAWKGIAPGETVLAPMAGAATAADFQPALDSTLLANESDSWRTIRCADTVLRHCGVTNLSGKPVLWPVVLAPRSSVVVVSADPRWDVLRLN